MKAENATASPPTSKPQVEELVIEGGRPRLRHSLRELRVFLPLIPAFAERDVRVKYKQAGLGAAWAVIQPLVFMGVFSLIAVVAPQLRVGGRPYAGFALSALVPWIFLNTAVTFGSNSLVGDAALLRKIYFPREIPVIGAVLASIIDLGIGLVLYIVVGPFIGAEVSWYWLMAPALVLPLVILATGVSLLFASLNVYYRDFRYALPLGLQLWMFASPVIYSASKIPEHRRLLYAFANPAAGILDSFTRVLFEGRAPDFQMLGAGSLVSLVLLGVAYLIFKRLERNFADVV